MWCWRGLLRVPWTARKSNQSILKEISLYYSLEGLMLKLKLQFFGHLMWRTDSFEKTLMLGKIEGGKRRGQQRMRWLDGHQLDGHEFEQALELVMDREAWRAAVHRVAESDMSKQLNWTELIGCPQSLACGPFLHLQSQQWAVESSYHTSLSSSLAPFFLFWGSIVIILGTWMIQGFPPILRWAY